MCKFIGARRHALTADLLHASFLGKGLDTNSLIVDLNNPTAYRDDDDVLPGGNSGGHYSFLRHRTLTGQEDLVFRGYPQRLIAVMR